ncbi:MAG TPA: hypothetical protein VI318_11280 [Baekduia sp.]
MQIGGIGEPTSASNYRVWYPLRALERLGHEAVFPNAEAHTPHDALLRCDAVIVYRSADPEAQDLIRRLRDNGVGVVWDNDDDYLNLPMTRQNRRNIGGTDGARVFAELVRTAQSAHVVTVTTPTLASVFAGAGVEGVRVIDNCLEIGPRPRLPHDGLTIGWIAVAGPPRARTRRGASPM